MKFSGGGVYKRTILLKKLEINGVKGCEKKFVGDRRVCDVKLPRNMCLSLFLHAFAKSSGLNGQIFIPSGFKNKKKTHQVYIIIFLYLTLKKPLTKEENSNIPLKKCNILIATSRISTH